MDILDSPTTIGLKGVLSCDLNNHLYPSTNFAMMLDVSDFPQGCLTPIYSYIDMDIHTLISFFSMRIKIDLKIDGYTFLLTMTMESKHVENRRRK